MQIIIYIIEIHRYQKSSHETFNSRFQMVHDFSPFRDRRHLEIVGVLQQLEKVPEGTFPTMGYREVPFLF